MIMKRSINAFDLLALGLAVAALLASLPSHAQNEPGDGSTPATSSAESKPLKVPIDDPPVVVEGKSSTKSAARAAVAVPPLSKAQEPDAPEKQDFEIDKADPNRQKTLVIYLGVEHVENLPYIPEKVKFKGDFKKYVSVSIDRSGNSMKLKTLRAGAGTLAIYDGKDRKIYEFKIEVSKNTLAKVANEMRSLLADIEGISIKIINERVVVDGQVLLPRDLNRIISVVGQYKSDVASSLVTLSPLAQRKIAQMIANDIGDNDITVRAVNDKFILEGLVDSAEKSERAKQIAEMYVPDLVKESGEKEGTISKLRRSYVLNLIQIKAAAPKEPGKIIQLVIHFVELNKNAENSFKFQFTPTLADNSAISFTNDSRSPGGVVSSITGVVSNLLPKLNWAKAYGHARVLQSSSMIVLDGQPGDLNNTTNIPFQSVNGQGNPVTQFAKAGLETSITPTIIAPRSDSIRLNMAFSMNSLLGITASGPMISSSNLKTVVIVKSGQSAAVGGLITNSTSTDYNKLPQNLTTDPIISLYASKSFQRNQSQFVVFVTPIIKASASQGAEKVKEKFRLHD